MPGDIVVNMIGQNNTSPAVGQVVASYGQLNGAINQHMNRLAGEHRARMALNQMLSQSVQEQSAAVQEQSRAIGVSSRQQAAIQQLVMAVDDASVSYGTGGLQGAIRGASNNLTAAAALMGPWGAAVAVGVSAVTQLGMAFMKTGEETAKSTSLLDDFERQIGAIDKAASRIRNRRDTIKPGGMSVVEAEQQKVELRKESNTIGEEIKFIRGEIPSLEQKLTDFVMKRTTTPDTDPIRGLSEADRTEYYRRQQQIEDLRAREQELYTERDQVIGDIKRIDKALPDLRQQEMDKFAADQAQADIVDQRRALADREAGRAMGAEIRNEMFKSSPRADIRRQGSEMQIKEEYQRRLDQINGMGGIDEATRQQMLSDAEAIAANQLAGVALESKVLSGRGPQALRSGDADTMRFLNQARLGASSKSAEERELLKLNTTAREQLTAYRESIKAQRDQPIEMIDF